MSQSPGSGAGTVGAGRSRRGRARVGDDGPVRDAFGAIQTALLLGGTSEIGLEVVRAVPRQLGCRVVLAGRRAPEPLPVIDDADVQWVSWDATVDRDGAGVAEAVATLGPGTDLDLVVVAAAVLGDQRRALAEPGHAAEILTTNLVGAGAALLAAGALLANQGHGTLVVLSSVAGLRPRRANFVYGASKAGLDALAVGLGDELVGSGARVVVVRPGFVRGRMTAGMSAAPFATTPALVGAAVARGVAANRDVVYVPAVLGPVFGLLRALPRPVFRRLPG